MVLATLVSVAEEKTLRIPSHLSLLMPYQLLTADTREGLSLIQRKHSEAHFLSLAPSYSLSLILLLPVPLAHLRLQTQRRS